MMLEDVMRDLDLKYQGGCDIARHIFNLPDILNILPRRVSFFSVVYGENPGIYEEWYVD
jgi:hypothetical protein